MHQVSHTRLTHAYQRGNAIVVAFENNHSVIFYPNYNSRNEATSLEQFRLVGPQAQVCADFYSPLQNPVQVRRRNRAEHEPEFGFDWLITSYVTEDILPYLAAAWNHLKVERPRDKGTGVDMWELVQESDELIQDVLNGAYPIPHEQR